MGCISSKLLPPGPDGDGERATVLARIDHVVSLTSTTYGVLDIHPKHEAVSASEEKEQPPPEQEKPISKEWKRASMRPPPLVVPNAKKSAAGAKPESGPEVINAWEIMAGLEDAAAGSSAAKKPSKPSRWSPARVIAMALPSPKRSSARKKSTPGKENSPLQRCSVNANNKDKPAGDIDNDRVLRPYNSIDNSKLSMAIRRFSPGSTRVIRKPGPAENGGGMSSRRSLSPLFDPDLLASIERELSEEGAHIKRMVGSEKPRHPMAAPPAIVAEGKCPPGGADAVVLYTTTLRGIRRTFEECNVVRAAIEAHDVKTIERDLSMDSRYKEELRLLLGVRELRVPAVFVRGKYVGGATEIAKLDEEGKLKALLDGLPRARVWCAGCAGVRFVMCRDCNGSRKVLDAGRKETVKCEACNENGLVRCPICS
jgi:glutaredoxin domain-containing cysteine-rich protein 1